MMWSTVAEQISRAIGQPFTIRGQSPVGGGCINDAVVVEDRDHRFFVKLNLHDRRGMFEAEAAGLAELARTQAVRVPNPICVGEAGGRSFLVLEHIRLDRASGKTLTIFGAQLAQLHRATAATFGWERDNTIGSTPQPNTRNPDWVDFWQHRRLGFQLTLARTHGARRSLLEKGERVIEATPLFFTTYRPQPALLHGDLWGGNVAADDAGNPVIFDPAVYYGDREADIAMTELFGGFSSSFYAAYNDAWPLDPGYAARKTLYNLYHILNHLNLFGGGYGAQAEGMMERLLGEVG